MKLSLLAVIFLFLPVESADGQTPTLTAVRLLPDDQITLDGHLTEQAWQRAIPASDFRQQDPHNGDPSTEQTQVRVLYGANRILLGVRCLDSEPSRILGNQMQRDQSIASDDRFMFAIDTYSDGRSGYYFEINPSGAMGDGLVLPGNGIQVNRSWDGIWNARVERNSEGWTAEIEIPLHTINFDRNSKSWGINFQRSIRRKNEESLWSGWARNQGLTYMTSAGRLEGLEGLDQGLGLDLLPYVLGSTSAAPGRDAPRSIQKGATGGDIVYNLTPALRANLSINTDFAETEVDQRQVNLTRFPLFFPEKRAFFLEGASVFDFSREPGNAIVPFFSRRIGLDDSGVPQPIDYGAKLTGQAGAFEIGALQVRTRDDATRPSENFSVLRSRGRFWRQSYVGGIVTRRDGAQTRARETAGMDFLLGTSHFLRKQVFEFSGFYLHTTKREATRGGDAFGVRLNFPNDPVNARISLREVQDGYDPAVGFTNRRSYRLVNPAMRYIVHVNRNPIVRRFSFEYDMNLFYNLQGQVETRRIDLQFMRLELQSSDQFEFHLVPTYEQLPRDFEIVSGVVLPAGGQYSFSRRNFRILSASRRRLSINAVYEDGSFYSGSRQQAAGTVSIRPNRGWLINASADYNRVALKEGRFTTRVWQGDVSRQFTPFISLVNSLQFDTVTRQLGWQSRFRWIIKPGDDVFIVYNYNWSDLSTFHTVDRKGSIKIVKTIRF